MYLEYNWMTDRYQPRFGNGFTAVNGLLSYESLEQAKLELAIVGLRLGTKTDSRTWKIVVQS